MAAPHQDAAVLKVFNDAAKKGVELGASLLAVLPDNVRDAVAAKLAEVAVEGARFVLAAFDIDTASVTVRAPSAGITVHEGPPPT